MTDNSQANKSDSREGLQDAIGLAAEEDPMQLLLPDPCLLAVLQHCADDLASLFSAARAHSRLHQAAVMALSSITVDGLSQQKADGLLQYLSKHGQHVDSMDLAAVDRTTKCYGQGTVQLRQLPPKLQLASLKWHGMHVQLQPGSGFQGVVRPGVSLKQLRLYDCRLLDGEEGLAAALALVPRLEFLVLAILHQEESRRLIVSTHVLSGLQQLTVLGLGGVHMEGPDQGAPALQPLQALTGLVDLRLWLHEPAVISTNMLSGLQRLTCLVLVGFPDSPASETLEFEPGVLAGKSQLQVLQLSCRIAGAAAGVTQLLRQLLHLQQLTHLSLRLGEVWVGDPPAAALSALSALTASSKLQYLYITHVMLPAAALQHIFPAGRQLQHLQSVTICGYSEPAPGGSVTAFGTRLVSCCPGLQSLDLRRLQGSAEVLVPLQGLSGLHTLLLDSWWNSFEAVCRLTGLGTLHLAVPDSAEGLLLQLTQLQQLTCLNFTGHSKEWSGTLTSKDPGDEPVWRQILRLHLDHSDPQVAEQAAAALGEQPSHAGPCVTPPAVPAV